VTGEIAFLGGYFSGTASEKKLADCGSVVDYTKVERRKECAVGAYVWSAARLQGESSVTRKKVCANACGLQLETSPLAMMSSAPAYPVESQGRLRPFIDRTVVSVSFRGLQLVKGPAPVRLRFPIALIRPPQTAGAMSASQPFVPDYNRDGEIRCHS
jgi:hypothetical protein